MRPKSTAGFKIEPIYLGGPNRIVACTLYADGKGIATIENSRQLKNADFMAIVKKLIE